uniref:Enhancer of polycomb homolog n=1 Tax=Poecilia latipinna TaxID=48699 RepID=A0A3B3W120_9TELE
MSKLSFRARALDASKPLPVFRCEDLPDLHEYASINRAVPQMPTGMEKEEESEHHLQRAISAQQVYGEKRDNMVIPVPEAESNITYYDSLYPGDYKMPKQLIHIQQVSRSHGLIQFIVIISLIILVSCRLSGRFPRPVISEEMSLPDRSAFLCHYWFPRLFLKEKQFAVLRTPPLTLEVDMKRLVQLTAAPLMGFS